MNTFEWETKWVKPVSHSLPFTQPHLAMNKVLWLSKKPLGDAIGEGAELHVGPQQVLGTPDASVASTRLASDRRGPDGEEWVREGDHILQLRGDCQRGCGQVCLLRNKQTCVKN